jgi:hypothetical protein
MIDHHVGKQGGRLMIFKGAVPVYCPPDFIRHTSRIPLQSLARTISLRGRVNIEDIVAYETAQPRKTSHGF